MTKQTINKEAILIIIYIVLLLIGREFALLGKFSSSTLMLPIMLCHLVFNRRGKTLKDIRTVNTLYLIYIVWFLLAGSLNGDFASNSGSLSLFINYFSCILIACLISLKVDDINIIDYILRVFVAILILNIFTSILQFFNIDLGWAIWKFFNPEINSIAEEHLKEAIQGGEQELGFSFSPGLFQSAVTNGYFMASFGLLPIVLAADESIKFKKILLYCIYIFSLITIFLIQQRAAFFVFIFLSLLILYKTISFHKGFLFILFISAVYFISTYDGTFDVGRLGEMSLEEDSRYGLFNEAIYYISHNLLFGGRVDFVSFSGKSAHNFIFNAFIYSGLVGAILLISIACKMFLASFKVVINRRLYHSYSLFFACALLAYLSIGLLHNESLATGTPVLFILYGLLVVSVNTNIQSK